MMQQLGLALLLALSSAVSAQTVEPAVDAGAPPSESVRIADFGAETRAPTADEAKKLSLPFAVRFQGQVTTGLAPNGPAAKAGIRIGDAILSLDANTVFSRDDIEDFLRVTPPKTRVKVKVVRGDTAKQVEILLTLGSRSARRPSGIAWKHAGLNQLAAVKKLSRDTRKWILIGLSGAET